MSYQSAQCNSGMEEGFLLEKGEGPILSAEAWVSGKPEKSQLSGLDLNGRAIYNVTTFRCITCGYLVSYAANKRKQS